MFLLVEGEVTRLKLETGMFEELVVASGDDVIRRMSNFCFVSSYGNDASVCSCHSIFWDHDWNRMIILFTSENVTDVNLSFHQLINPFRTDGSY